jgi:CubicO group peptidase (beta-lactamase class C family)
MPGKPMSGTMTMHDRSREIDRFVERVRDHWQVPGVAIAVVNEGVPIYVQAYGVASLADGTSADIHTAFPIGSCSKAFTGFIAAVLVDSGVIKWDDPLRKLLPTLTLHDPWVAEHITIRDALANRTGLSRASLAEYGSDLSLYEVIEHAREIQPTCEFRDRFSYCNVGFVAAAEALSAAAGMPFAALLRDRLRLQGCQSASRKRRSSSKHRSAALPGRHRGYRGACHAACEPDGSEWSNAECS